MRGSPIIRLIINLLPGPEHTSVKLSHQVVRRPDGLGHVVSKLTTRPRSQTAYSLSTLVIVASAFLFVKKHKQGCKIQILTGYLLKRFSFAVDFTPSEIRNM